LKLLLDTHVWIWSLVAPRHLTSRVVRALRSPANELWLSPVSTWELLVLVEKGRVVLDVEPDEWLDEAMRRAPLREAPITHDIARESRRIKLPHQDPADRFLAATAKVLGLTLVTADERLMGSRELSVLRNA
jgi:PIN domain nuclease of toxin-antitoxin system